MEDEELQDLANSVCLKDEARDFNDEPISIAEASALLSFCDDQMKVKSLDPELKQFYLKVKDVIMREMTATLH